MNFLELQEPSDGGCTNRETLHHSRAPPLRVLERAQTFDETRLYRKRLAPSTANGSFGGLGRKIVQRQNSTPVNFSYPPSTAAASASTQQRRASTAGAAQKLLAAKKRKQELLERKNLATKKRGWPAKLKSFATVCVSTLLVLAGSSLLFTSLLIVDPILVGLHAQFRNEPGICRTSMAKNTTGPGNCVMPSCREGCTADLYTCTFLYVMYFEPPDLNISFVRSYYKVEIKDWDPDEFDEFLPLPGANATNNSYHNNNISQNITAILMINPNGCGYPPEINCSDFYDRFSRNGTVFPCFYSDSFFNEELGVAVPFYDRSHEIMNLGLYGGISVGAIIVLSCFLLLLTKIKIQPKISDSTETDQYVDMENQSTTTETRTPPARNPTVDDSTRLIDKEATRIRDGLIEMAERRNGHGPKKKEALIPTPSSISLLGKTDMAAVHGREEVQPPSTSRTLP